MYWSRPCLLYTSIHGAGKPEEIWTAEHDLFLEAMADAAKSITDRFAGRIGFVNIMRNMSVDCDCCAVAEDPKLADIGILASLDPVSYTHLDVYKRQLSHKPQETFPALCAPLHPPFKTAALAALCSIGALPFSAPLCPPYRGTGAFR